MLAPRVSKSLIARLYQRDAIGVVDDELIAEVGYALLMRCEGCLQGGRAREGEAPCPNCNNIIEHDGMTRSRKLECPACGWSGFWKEYKRWYRSTWLGVGGLEPFVREFVATFPKVRDARHRMILIDQLIHRIHDDLVAFVRQIDDQLQVGGRPLAMYLIAVNNYDDARDFLDGLSYSDRSTPQVLQRRKGLSYGIEQGGRK